ncbi:MAG TPA: hypothetical protein VLG25_02030 [Patescibacteria group bacterium]|nr:hypothetical protein [Patescibacteria group bacterium]
MGAVALLAIIAFEVYMFLDVLKNPGLSDNERIIWVLGMFLLHPVIAIVYYFVAHSRLNTHPE